MAFKALLIRLSRIIHEQHYIPCLFSSGLLFPGFALKSAHSSTTTDRFATDVVM